MLVEDRAEMVGVGVPHERVLSISGLVWIIWRGVGRGRGRARRYRERGRLRRRRTPRPRVFLEQQLVAQRTTGERVVDRHGQSRAQGTGEIGPRFRARRRPRDPVLRQCGGHQDGPRSVLSKGSSSVTFANPCCRGALAEHWPRGMARRSHVPPQAALPAKPRRTRCPRGPA